MSNRRSNDGAPLEDEPSTAGASGGRDLEMAVSIAQEQEREVLRIAVRSIEETRQRLLERIVWLNAEIAEYEERARANVKSAH